PSAANRAAEDDATQRFVHPENVDVPEAVNADLRKVGQTAIAGEITAGERSPVIGRAAEEYVGVTRRPVISFAPDDVYVAASIHDNVGHGDERLGAVGKIFRGGKGGASVAGTAEEEVV